MSATYTRAEFETLRALRERFLSSQPGAGGYWRSREELALYDRTFAERIGWKWDAVLRELRARGWRPASQALVDWGCGSGVAARRVLAEWRGQFSEAWLHDDSALACEVARESLLSMSPEVQVRSGYNQGAGAARPRESADEREPLPPVGPGLILLSHVLNELDDDQLAGLLANVREASEIIWVESGTHANSRRLIAEVRERLVGSGDFAVVAPCTHRERCGLFVPENDRHWCHSFAPTPREIFQDAGWMHLGRELGIDLRATPYAFLVLEKKAPAPPSGAARVIGRPRDYKGYSKLLSCEASGVHERMLQKRDAPELLKAVQAEPEAPIFRWELAGGKIVSGTPAT